MKNIIKKKIIKIQNEIKKKKKTQYIGNSFVSLPLMFARDFKIWYIFVMNLKYLPRIPILLRFVSILYI